MCRQNMEDFEDFEEECKKGYVDDDLLDNPPVDNCEGFKALLPLSKNKMAKGAWSSLLLAVTNNLCHEPVKKQDKATSRS